MANQYSSITKANFNGSWYPLNGSNQAWSDSHSNKDQCRYVYVCCACWYIVASVSYAIFGGSGIFQIYVSYWTGTAWSSETHWEVNGSSTGKTMRFGHNRDEGNANALVHNTYPIWRIRYWPSRSNNRWSINIYCGGWGLATTNYPSSQKIYSIGTTGSPLHYAYTTSMTPKDSGFPFRPGLRQGQKIMSGYDHELINYPYNPYT